MRWRRERSAVAPRFCTNSGSATSVISSLYVLAERRRFFEPADHSQEQCKYLLVHQKGEAYDSVQQTLYTALDGGLKQERTGSRADKI